MKEIIVAPGPDAWRASMREALAMKLKPAQVHFQSALDRRQLLDFGSTAGERTGKRLRVPQAFLTQARFVACHREADRYKLIYHGLWDLAFGLGACWQDPSDPNTIRTRSYEKAVRRDAHKTRAFVRFRRCGEKVFAAWHGASHFVLPLLANFFRDRFSDMSWKITTPLESMWFGDKEFEDELAKPSSNIKRQLFFGPGTSQSDANIPKDDELDEAWKTYYRATFNPSRVNRKAMLSEMPIKYWSTMPETELVAELMSTAASRTRAMVAGTSLRGFGPQTSALATVEELAGAVRTCTLCELCEETTQAVPGRGARGGIMIVGEQPGDQEDKQGQPFCGPSGDLLRAVLSELGLKEDKIYFTNTVKHFRYVWRGKRRLHQRPTKVHINSCRPWLIREMELVQPRVIVALGATAARAIMGQTFEVAQRRGELVAHELFGQVVTTWHPSALLRTKDPRFRERKENEFRSALELAARCSQQNHQVSPCESV